MATKPTKGEGWNWLDFVVVVVWVSGKTGTALPVNSRWALARSMLGGEVVGFLYPLFFGKETITMTF